VLWAHWTSRGPGRGVTEGMAAHQVKAKHRQCGNMHNSDRRGASNCKVTGGNSGLPLPIAIMCL